MLHADPTTGNLYHLHGGTHHTRRKFNRRELRVLLYQIKLLVPPEHNRHANKLFDQLEEQLEFRK